MNRIFRLCKKVSDPPEETKGEWNPVACCACDVPLRATVKATAAAKTLGVDLNPICFDCAAKGPDVINHLLGPTCNCDQPKTMKWSDEDRCYCCDECGATCHVD